MKISIFFLLVFEIASLGLFAQPPCGPKLTGVEFATKVVGGGIEWKPAESCSYFKAMTVNLKGTPSTGKDCGRYINADVTITLRKEYILNGSTIRFTGTYNTVDGHFRRGSITFRLKVDRKENVKILTNSHNEVKVPFLLKSFQGPYTQNIHNDDSLYVQVVAPGGREERMPVISLGRLQSCKDVQYNIGGITVSLTYE